MGQYHVVYNLDKKECFSFSGAKLWEKAYSATHSMALLVLLSNSNGRGGGDLINPIYKDVPKKGQYENCYSGKKATKSEYEIAKKALKEISGRWAGDRIVVQGDYAKKEDKAFITDNEFPAFVDISKKILLAIKALSNECADECELELKYKS